MKLKEFGPGGARPKFYYLDPPLDWNKLVSIYFESCSFLPIHLIGARGQGFNFAIFSENGMKSRHVL